nr:PAS domain S-box protein [Bowmanella yangjiangensis]
MRRIGFIGFVLLLIVAAVTMFSWNISKERERAIIDTDRKLKDQVSLRAEHLQESLDSLKRNVMFLASVPPISGLARSERNDGFDTLGNSSSEVWKDRLQQIFIGFIQSHPSVMQARYIGRANNGKELVRVDWVDGKVQVIPEAQLQPKANRDYFTEAMILAPGQLYISEINLNREYGELEIPYRPTLRIATPVWDEEEAPFGLVILNIDANALLDNLNEGIGADEPLYLTNQRGDFLLHPNSDVSFGFDKGQVWRWQDEFEQGQAPSGHLLVRKGNEVFYVVQHNLALDDVDPRRFVTLRMLYSEMAVNEIAAAATGKLFASMLLGMGAIGCLVLLYWLNVRQRQQLQEQQGRLAAIVTNSQDAVISADLDGVITDWNLAAERIFGYRQDEVLKQNYTDLMVPEDKRDESERALEMIRQGKMVLPYDTLRKHKDGSLIELSVSVTPVLDDNQMAIGVAAIMRDIGRQKAVERQIQQLNLELEQRVAEQTAEISEMHRLQKAILAQAGHAVIASDLEGTIVMFNPAAEKMLGYAAKDIIGKQTPAIFHLEWEVVQRAEQFSQELQEDIQPGFDVFICKSRHGLPNAHEWTYVRADKSELPVLLSVTSLLDEKGQITGYLGMASDITQQVRARRELESTKEHLLKAVEVGELGVWQWDVASDKLEWNEQMYRIYQLPSNHVLTYKSWFDTLHPDDRDTAVETLTEALAGNGTFNPEFRVVRPNGDIRIVQASAAMEWNQHHEVVRVVGINRDITVQRTYEETLQAARREADSANRAKSVFLANMSHEIRTPMNAILGLLQLLIKSRLESNQLDYVRKAESAGRLLLGILNDILDFSRVEAGKLELDPQPCNLDVLMMEVGSIVAADIGKKQLEILFDIDTNTPRLVIADSLRLQQILVNLAGNAIKFTEQGEVTLSLKLLSREGDKLRLEFRVKDSGIGIAESQLQHIFDGFRQAESSTARRYGGSGLGLAISQRLVRQMGGELSVSSELSKGSEFYFTLPCQLAEERDWRSLPKDLKVLIVDDNAGAREVLTSMVESFGWQAETLSQGDLAISYMAKGGNRPPCDLLLMDWVMPGMDGWETCECIRAMYPSDKLPMIIMVTAHGDELLRQHDLHRGDIINAHLLKPVTPSMLLDAVADIVVQKQRFTSPAAVGRTRLKGLTLLLAEDNPTNQQVATELLQLEGAEVVVAHNGIEAVEKVADPALDFDLVLMDIQMPEMDGYAATREIRQVLGNDSLPIIAMTANAMDTDKIAASEAGMNDHIGKPFELDHLVALILKCLGRSDEEMAMTAAVVEEHELALDSAVAIKRMGGNQEVYGKALASFLKDEPLLVAKLPIERPVQDCSVVADVFHTIKGMTAMIGANCASKTASQLEVLLRKNSEGDYQQLLEKLQQQLKKTTEEVQQWLDVNRIPASGMPELDDVELGEALVRLESLLESSDVEALQQFELLAGPLHETLPELALIIEQALEIMDYEKALIGCRRALQLLQVPQNAGQEETQPE